MLWSTWLIANICMWMNDVAAAWLMTSLTVAPIWVALVHTASTLPVFVLGLPGGALADMLDRRRYLIFTQFWVAVVALALCVAILSDVMSPWLLLVLTFANGIGRAMRLPVFAAIVPDLVPRAQLPAALALNGVAQNFSRIVGPLIAGALIASAGSTYVFVLNAVLSVISGFIIMRWRSERVVRTREREPLLSAMRVGVQFVRQSAHMKIVLLRVSLFFFHSTALLALLPLVARDLGGGAGTYTLLLAFMGGGAIVTVMFLPRMRQSMSRDTRVMCGTLLQAAATALVAFAQDLYVALPAMFLSGMATISAANSLAVSAQLALPNWVRARAMAMYQMALMGAIALGAALWGQVATISTVQTSLAGAAGSSVLLLLMTHRLLAERTTEES
jgi:MFS family permease